MYLLFLFVVVSAASVCCFDLPYLSTNALASATKFRIYFTLIQRHKRSEKQNTYNIDIINVRYRTLLLNGYRKLRLLLTVFSIIDWLWQIRCVSTDWIGHTRTEEVTVYITSKTGDGLTHTLIIHKLTHVQ